MARMYNMAIVPWSALGSGKLKPKNAVGYYELQLRKPTVLMEDQMEKSIADGSLKEDSEEVRFTRTLLDIASARGLNTWAPIALAYLYTKYPLVFPLVGIESKDVSSAFEIKSKAESVQQLQDSMQGIDIILTPEEMRRIEGEWSFYNRSDLR